MYDLTGGRYNWTVAAGLPEVQELLWRRDDGSALDFAGVTLRCVAHGLHGGKVAEVPVEHGGEVGSLLLTMPALDADVWSYELYAQFDDGQVQRLLYGSVAALSTVDARKVLESAGALKAQQVLVHVPEEVGGVVSVRARGTTALRALMAEARVIAQQAEDAVKKALSIEDAAEKVDDALRKLQGLDTLLERFRAELRSQITVDPVTGCWVIAGEVTTFPSRGAAGADGSAFRYVQITAAEDLDNVPEGERFGYFYFIPHGALYVWARKEDGAYGWCDISGTGTGTGGGGGAGFSSVVPNGAVRYMSGTDWRAAGVTDLLIPGQMYLGVLFSGSFYRDALRGLCLAEATTERLGGVTLASAIAPDAQGVPTAAMVAAALPDAYTKGEADGRFITPAAVAEAYLRKDGAEATYLTQAAATQTYLSKAGAEATFMKMSEGVERVVTMLEEDYAALAERGEVDEATLYILT